MFVVRSHHITNCFKTDTLRNITKGKNLMKSVPIVQKYMTTTPYSVEAEQNLSQANNMMREYQIRHLPVMKSGQISGILSDRDLNLALSMNGVSPTETTVGQISTEEVFLVRPDSKLDEVVKTMADKKIGSVLVVDHHKLVGIFTTTDALRALGELLETRLSH